MASPILILWIKALHLIFAVAWFAALFYLPRLFVYHTMARDSVGIERFKLMEYRLYRRIMTPAMLLTLLFGLWLFAMTWTAYASSVWVWVKLILVLGLCGYHGACGRFVRLFAADANTRSDRFFRWFNEVPTLALVLIVCLAVIKP